MKGPSDRMAAADRECERLVGEQDPDRAVSVPFAPAEKRRHLLALYAFNIETARVREQVSQPLPGEIRLQWWRDRLAAGPDTGDAEPGGQGHPVAEALIRTVDECALPREALDRFVEARIFDLYDDPMPSRTAFEAYAGETASALIMLAAMILDAKSAPQISDAAGHAGVAQTAAGMLRLLPIHRARGQIFLPADILASAGCSPEALLVGEPEPTRRAVAAMAAYAREHVLAYQAARRSVPPAVRAAFLPAELTGLYLDAIEAAGGKDEAAAVRIGPFRRTFAYWRAMRR